MVPSDKELGATCTPPYYSYLEGLKMKPYHCQFATRRLKTTVINVACKSLFIQKCV